MIEVASLSDEELAALLDEARLEYQRRRDLTSAIDSTPGLIEALLTTTGRADGEEYVPPTGAHDAYPKDWRVQDDGKTYRSTRNGARGIPGKSPDWIQEPDGDEVLEWEQWHAGSEYPVGSIVSLEGRLYRNDHRRPNGWKPGTVGSQWTDIGPA